MVENMQAIRVDNFPVFLKYAVYVEILRNQEFHLNIIMKSGASNNFTDLVGHSIKSSHPKYMKTSPRSGSSSGPHRKTRHRYLKLIENT